MALSVGVDVAEERKGLDLVALDDQRVITDRIAHASVSDAVTAIVRISPDVVCIDSPPAWAHTDKSRAAERALRPLGITAFSTPPDPGDHAFYRWMRVGFAVFNGIADRYPYYRDGEVQGTALEVFPEASATLLTGTLCPKGQKGPFRRAILRAYDIDDMQLPNIDAVDAALAALTGLRALEGQFTALGDPVEGVIVVPVATLPGARLERPLTGVSLNSSCRELGDDAPTISGRNRRAALSVIESSGSQQQSSRRCECGCGAVVSRRFLPGHDAKLKSRLLLDASQGDPVAEQRLRQLGWLHRTRGASHPAAPTEL